MNTPTIRINDKFYRALLLPDGTCMVRQYTKEDAEDSDFNVERLYSAQETAAILCQHAQHQNSWA